jgi:GBP family porin
MKKSIIALAALIVAGAAQAESSVTLYGLVDAGVTFVNNQAGNNNIKMDSGVMNGNRWGLRGREELTSDLAAIFRVESGFSLDNGNSGQGGKLFGRQAFAGLDIKDVGTITFGRQYDFMGDIGDYTIAANQFGSVYTLESTGIFHNDSGLGSRATGGRVDNSVKFQSANLGGSGVTAGAMVGLGENAANKKANRVVSAAVGFDGIPNFSSKLAYTQLRDATGNTKTQILGLGASYDLGFGKVNGVFTNNQISASGSSIKLKASVYEVGYTHRITSQLSAGIGYQYFDNRSTAAPLGYVAGTVAKKLDMHGASIALDYAFSKRTDAYFLTVFNKAKTQNVGNTSVRLAPDITGSGASDGNNQVAVRVGLRHRF